MTTRASVLRRLTAERRGQVGLGLLAPFIVVALAGSWLTPYDATELVAGPHEPPSLAHWLGTTGRGQDVLSQTMVGARVTLAVGFSVGLLVTLLGAIVGGAAGYCRGQLRGALNLLINVSLVIPGLPLAVVLAAYLPASPVSLAFVLVATGWAWNARVLRAQTLSLGQRDFVLAAQVSGEPGWRILGMEILPNMSSLLFSCFISATLHAIAAQVGLEYLGLGDVGQVSWGTNLYWASNDAAWLTGAWWTILPTGLCLAGVGSGLVFLNFALDELGNPRLAAALAWDRYPNPRRDGATPVRRDYASQAVPTSP